MEIEVVVFGVAEVVNLVEEVSKEFNNLTIIKVIYYLPSEVEVLLKKHQYDGDILLFCAPIPYLVALDFQTKNKIKFNKPMVFIPFNESSIYPFLFNIFKDSNIFSNQANNFSIDYPSDSKIKECIDSLNIDRNRIYEFSQYSYLDMDLNKVLLFHYNLWLEKKTVACATTYYSVYKTLTKPGISTYFIVPTRSVITQTFHRLIAEMKVFYQPKFQIAIGIINFNHIHNANNRTVSEYEINRKRLALQQILLDYIEDIQAILHWTNNDEVLFITTRGDIERNTKSFKEIEILHTIKTKLNIPSSFGIGFGRTANEAKTKAHEALIKATEYGEDSCFAIEIDGTVYGPIGRNSNLEYSARSNDPLLLSIAKESELSIGTINKLIAFWISIEKVAFTTVDLASSFGITLRSARRILNKLEQNNFAKVIGEEQPSGRGRPRYLYKLILDNELSQNGLR